MNSDSLFNRDAEKPILARLLVNPSLRAEIRLDPSDFSPDANRVVLSAIDACIASGTEFSKFLVIQYLNTLGVKLGGVIEPGVYINSLEMLQITDQGAIGLAKEVKRWTVLRECHAIGQDIIALTNEKPGKDKKVKKASEIVSDVTAAFTRRVNLLGGGDEDEPKDLYASLRTLLEQENAFDTNSIPTPFPIYNDMYGWLDAGQIYCIAARAKVGKSTWVMSMLDQIMRQDDDFCALMLDTELTLEEVGFRLVSSLTGVKEFYIRHKFYLRRGYEDMRKKVEGAFKLVEPFLNRVDHQFIGGMGLEQQLSIARRWVFKKQRLGKRCLLVYDYFKLNAGSEFDSNQSRDIVIGKKVDAYKNLAKELRIPIWALVQANRENEESKAGGKIRSGAVIAGSDMISQFCSNIYLLEKLSAEERVALGQILPTDATHSLINIYPRQLGPNEGGHDCLVKYVDAQKKERWKENYLLYSFHNFKVTEVGTFKQIMERNKTLGVPVQNTPPPDAPMLD